jgi:EAL domain-containing protein (putative c-di-GMP-specific phosphodiesterase class I)
MWVSMNLSPLQLADPDIVGLLADAVGSEDLDPSRFVVEVTESSVLERRARDGRPVVEVLDDIVALGVRLAVDDFGTGASSLSRLGVFPASGLKVDQSFTARLGDDPLGAAVVRAMLSLGAELDCQVVVEGVETVAQLDELNRLGAPYAQGFLFAAGLWLHDAARVADAASLPVAGPYAAA